MMKKGSIEMALEAASRHLAIHKKPLFTSLSHAKEAIPQFEVGYGERLAAYKQSVPHLLLGNYLEGPSVESCIKNSWQVASQLSP
jgi:protoporphyrinogen oxidase